MTARLAVGLAFVAAVAAQTTRSVWDGVYTAEQAKRGLALYGKECASCHGSDLTGGESAPPLTGAGFLSNWTGQTVGDLFERTRQSMPQNNPGKLSRTQNADVIAYLLSMSGFPEGKAELDKVAEVLKQIRIDEKK
ncbi:MAG TPA: cytochrome c [Bryobacteraceae bacterium]|jgi:quinoprotein glucose dehydrogenase|nr:cytochrome c [Bryobacteraceae bacterium]